MSGTPLKHLYEKPSTILSSGVGRAERQAAMLVRVALKAQRPLRVADIGCGDGMCTELALQACARTPGADVAIVGLDWSKAALKAAKDRGVTAARASLEGEGLPLPDESMDVVVMSELIEHLVDPDAALEEVLRILKPGGTLLLSTPNLAAWYNRVLLAIGVQPLFSEVSLRGIYGRPGSDVVGHLRLFTRRALRDMLQAFGFVRVEISGAPYHDVPRPFRPLDRALCRLPGLSSNLLCAAEKPSRL